MTMLRFVVPALFASLLMVACESDGGGGTADVATGEDVTTESEVAGGVDIVAEPDQAGTPDISVVTDVDETPDVDPREPAGGVIVWQAESIYLDRANASASFQWYEAPTAAEVNYGPCAIAYLDPEAVVAKASLDAGTINVSGTTPTATLSFETGLDLDGYGYVSSLASDNVSLHPAAGQPVTVSAAGGADLPAFEITAITPEPVEIDSPSSGPFDSIADDEDLVVSWNAATANSAVVTVSGLDASGSPVAGETVVCTLDGDPGTYTVPAAALAHLPGTAARALVSVTRAITVSEPLLSGEVTLNVTASSGVAPLFN